MKGFTIGPLASAVGVPTSTLRFYERAGLLKPDARTGGNYREYGEKALDRLRFIRSAQATGFSLDDIREFLSLTHSDDPPCEEVLTLTKKLLAHSAPAATHSRSDSTVSALRRMRARRLTGRGLYRTPGIVRVLRAGHTRTRGNGRAWGVGARLLPC